MSDIGNVTSALAPNKSVAPAPKGKGRAGSMQGRRLMRWTETMDQELLLAIDTACKRKGVKIPWADVAQLVGPNATAGAVEQHIAKLRKKRESLKDLAIPSVQSKYGHKARLPSTVGNTSSLVTKPTNNARVSGKRKINRMKYERTNDDEDESASGLDPDAASDPEADYDSSSISKKRRNQKRMIEDEDHYIGGSSKKKRKLTKVSGVNSASDKGIAESQVADLNASEQAYMKSHANSADHDGQDDYDEDGEYHESQPTHIVRLKIDPNALSQLSSIGEVHKVEHDNENATAPVEGNMDASFIVDSINNYDFDGAAGVGQVEPGFEFMHEFSNFENTPDQQPYGLLHGVYSFASAGAFASSEDYTQANSFALADSLASANSIALQSLFPYGEAYGDHFENGLDNNYTCATGLQLMPSSQHALGPHSGFSAGLENVDLQYSDLISGDQRTFGTAPANFESNFPYEVFPSEFHNFDFANAGSYADEGSNTELPSFEG